VSWAVPKAFPDTLLDFQRMFPDEAACVRYLEELRWPEGFIQQRPGHRYPRGRADVRRALRREVAHPNL